MWFIFITRNLYLLIPFTCFAHIYTPTSHNVPLTVATTGLFYETVSLHLFGFLDSTHEWKLWYMSFSLLFWMFSFIIHSLPQLKWSFISGILNQRVIISLHPLIFFNWSICFLGFFDSASSGHMKHFWLNRMNKPSFILKKKINR